MQQNTINCTHNERDFRFLHICHVQKFEISPHDRFFLHGHCPCVRDKYEVCFCCINVYPKVKLETFRIFTCDRCTEVSSEGTVNSKLRVSFSSVSIPMMYLYLLRFWNHHRRSPDEQCKRLARSFGDRSASSPISIVARVITVVTIILIATRRRDQTKCNGLYLARHLPTLFLLIIQVFCLLSSVFCLLSFFFCLPFQFHF